MVVGLLPILVIAGIVYAVLRTRSQSQAGATGGLPANTRGPRLIVPDVEIDLTRWVDAGLLTPSQSSAIQAYERERVAAAPPAPEHRPGVGSVAEALGYLGGLLATIGLVLAIAQYWTDMAVGGRIAIAAAGAIALLSAGAVVPEHRDPALARLRWFLWLASSAATALLAAVIAVDGFDASAEVAVISASGAVAVHSGLLWFWRDRPLQELAFLAATIVFTGSLVAEISIDGAGGFAVWIVAAIALAAGVTARIPNPLLATVTGSVALVVGAIMVTSEWEGTGSLFAVATALGLLALATVPRLAPARPHQVVVTIVGALALFLTLPGTLAYFSRDAGFVTGALTWAAGALLLAAAMQRRVLQPRAIEVFGAATMLGGAALTATQVAGAGPVLGILTAIGLIALGAIPGHVVLSVVGSLGLLVNVPWAMGHFFPGGNRAPLLILVSGLLVLAVALGLSRLSGRLRQELGRGP
jgi:hypothetical protein